jgi:hypothetical protein
MLGRLWTAWKRFGQRLADIQARIILTLIYFLVLAPYGLVVRLLRDPLGISRPREASTWLVKPDVPATLDAARRQF